MKQTFDVEKAYYQLLSDAQPLNTFPWTDFTRAMYARWTTQCHIYSPFTAFQEAFFPISSYSRRISYLRYMQQAAYSVIGNEHHQKEWVDDISALIKYNERLRELKQRDIIITAPRWEKHICTMDEASLLFEHITPEELVAFMQLTPQFMGLLSINRSPKHLLSYYSFIYGEKRIAGLGDKSMDDFLRDYVAVSSLRSLMISGISFSYFPPIKPLPPSFRNECFDLYIRERMKKINEELTGADDTRPYPPTEQECLQVMLEQDRANAGMHKSQPDDAINDRIAVIEQDPFFKQLGETMQLKLQQVTQAYGEPVNPFDMSALASNFAESLQSLDKLEQCYLRYLEDRMIHADNKQQPAACANRGYDRQLPPLANLQQVFRYKFTQTKDFERLISFLVSESKQASDADWRHHAWEIQQSGVLQRIKGKTVCFTDWLTVFGELFDRLVDYQEPGKVRKVHPAQSLKSFLPMSPDK